MEEQREEALQRETQSLRQIFQLRKMHLQDKTKKRTEDAYVLQAL